MKKAYMVRKSKYLWEVRYGTSGCYQFIGIMPLCDAERTVEALNEK